MTRYQLERVRPGPRRGARYQKGQLGDVSVCVLAVHQEHLISLLHRVKRVEAVVSLNMFLQLTSPPALSTADMALVWSDACVYDLVLIEVPFIGELLVAVLTGKREYSLMNQLFVLFHVFSVLRDLATYITSKGWKVHCLVSHVQTMSVELVFL